MHFANAQYLYLLWLIPVAALLFWWAFREKRKRLHLFAEEHLLADLVSCISGRKQSLQAVLFLLLLAFALLALVRPEWGTKLEPVKREGVDIMVALDPSLSMEAQDVVPSRLEKAKHEVK